MANVLSDHQTNAFPEENKVSAVQRTSPALWLLLLLVLLAAATWWLGRDNGVPAAPGVTDSTTPTVVIMADETTPPAAVPAQKQAQKPANVRARTPALARSRDAIPVSGNVEPRYPVAALRAGIGGTVLVRARIDANGMPADVVVARRSGNRDLDRAAVDAVRKWRFQPAQRDGKAVASVVQVPVDFRPSQG